MVSTVTANTITTGTTASSTSTSSAISSDFQTFLTMLTAQMQNQDPLNPVDATDYATQLATFSSVEQQVLTNDLLTALTEQLTDSSFQQLAAWIGKEALSTAAVRFEGGPITLRPVGLEGADNGRLVVRDENGDEVEAFQIDLSLPIYTWDGLDESGDPYPDGIYSFEVESYYEGELVAVTPAWTYSRIEEVRDRNGVIVLTLSDGTEVEATAITGLRDPSV